MDLMKTGPDMLISARAPELSAPAGAPPEKQVDRERLERAVHDFEALFINHMLKTMRTTVMKSGLLGGGMREDIYTSLFDWEISKDMAGSGGIGLGKMLLGELDDGGLKG